MRRANIFENIRYDDESVVIEDLFETPQCKELRVIMQANQSMHDHQSDHPVVIEVVRGVLHVEIENESFEMVLGDLIEINAGVLHHLTAQEDTLLRVSLLKY